MKMLPLHPTDAYDIGFKNLIKLMYTTTMHTKDDGLYMVVGLTGSGKSSLALHGLVEFSGAAANVKDISQTREDLADNLCRIAKQPLPRISLYDEGLVSKRNALSKWNKELLDLYLTIRGKRIFHIWATPSLQQIDEPFVRERVSGVFFVYTKGRSVRYYYFFTKNAILNILFYYKNLQLETLDKQARKYALYRGWFRPYNGPLWEGYQSLKEDRMDQRLEAFKEQFGTNESEQKYYRTKDLQKMFFMSSTAVLYFLKSMRADNSLVLAKDYITSPTGTHFYYEQALPKITEYMRTHTSKGNIKKDPSYRREVMKDVKRRTRERYNNRTKA